MHWVYLAQCLLWHIFSHPVFCSSLLSFSYSPNLPVGLHPSFFSLIVLSRKSKLTHLFNMFKHWRLFLSINSTSGSTLIISFLVVSLVLTPTMLSKNLTSKGCTSFSKIAIAKNHFMPNTVFKWKGRRHLKYNRNVIFFKLLKNWKYDRQLLLGCGSSTVVVLTSRYLPLM